ncbi:MAG: hypothetical protein HWN67_05895 [Candidatus Helarchaeota archaeon]|nr:hypothetical protein [Candidatus Helarchaeota archaeon]
MTEMIEYFQVLSEKIGLIFERLSEFGGTDLLNALNLSVATNLEITDEEKTPYLSLVISQNKQKILTEKNPAINFNIRSTKDMWIRVFSGEESLIYNVVSGAAKVSNLRANWMNAMMFSILLSSLISLKILKFK